MWEDKWMGKRGTGKGMHKNQITIFFNYHFMLCVLLGRFSD